jgi:hypothetical protein
LFFIQPTWHAVGIILALVGPALIGPRALITMALLSTVMTIDPRIALMPLAANALHFSDRAGVRPYALSGWLTVAIVLALAVGVVGTLYFEYNDGANGYAWGTNHVPKLPFNLLARNLPKMSGPATMTLDRDLLLPAGIGLGGVLACSLLRLRFHWWPIHPVLLLMWGTYPMGRLAPSFLAGWFLKVAVSRFGGGQTYRKYKPIFVGMVAGEFVAGIFWIIVAQLYYQVFGVSGPKFDVHP